MTLSRWKIMAAGLGVSLGGLAALAGQCPKDVTKSGQVADAPPPLESPVIPAAASAPGAAPKAVPPAPPATSPVPDLPPIPSGLPSLPTPPSAEPVKLPDTPVSSPAMPPVLPAGGAEPMKVAPPAPSPDLPDIGVPIVPMRTTPTPGKPTPPAAPPPPPAPATDLKPLSEPPAPPAGLTYPKPTPPTTAPSDPLIGALKATPPSPGGTPSVPAPLPGSPPLDPPPPPPTRALTVPDGGTTSMEIKHAQLATKFRILLRVGEGEPTFEVRCGDDLVLKVACEKVDVKSPEKGSGLSAVKASGKVRFAGFGAEGTCDELSFLAGSGEVVLAGGVNIKVKDKLGRIESELSAESAKYKLDPCPTGSR